MNEEKTLEETLKEFTDGRNMNTTKLAEASNVPERYIMALTNGDFTALPPAPYIRGYLFKIASVLDIQGEDLWQQYKKQIAPKSSGALDLLPSNRFVIQPLNKKWAILSVLTLVIGTYLAVQLPSILGQPTIRLATYDENSSYTVATAMVMLSGTIKPGDKLTINNEQTYADAEGTFEKEILLQKGLNTVEITVSRFLGRQKKIVKQFDFEPTNQPAPKITPPVSN